MESFVKFKIIRTENQLTQSQVAQALGITRSAYCSYEIGRRKMSMDMLEALAEFYRLPITYFLKSEELLGDSEHYGEPKMYLSSLSKEERELIVKFRTLSDSGKVKIKSAMDKATEPRPKKP